MVMDNDRSPSSVRLTGTEGCPVFSSDSQELGHVKEVAGVYFKVDAPLQPDYWLSQEEVASANREQVVLNRSLNELDSVKRTRPGPGPRAPASGEDVDPRTGESTSSGDVIL